MTVYALMCSNTRAIVRVGQSDDPYQWYAEHVHKHKEDVLLISLTSEVPSGTWNDRLQWYHRLQRAVRRGVLTAVHATVLPLPDSAVYKEILRRNRIQAEVT